jgi:hypothetical protein
MLCASFSNRGVNLWAVDLITVPLVAGQSTYNVNLNTVMILDAYMQVDNGGGQTTDRIIMPVSRTEYASYPNKEQEGFTTTFWFDRLISPNPTVTLWPVPDGSSAQYLKYYRPANSGRRPAEWRSGRDPLPLDGRLRLWPRGSSGCNLGSRQDANAQASCRRGVQHRRRAEH